MKYLLDTNAFIALLGDPDLLSLKYRQLLVSGENTFVLSPASIWEMAIKVRLGKLSFHGGLTLDDLTTTGRIGQGVRLLPIKQAHLRAIVRLPKVSGHGDPFDFLIIAQALTENLPVLTTDRYFKDYGVRVV